MRLSAIRSWTLLLSAALVIVACTGTGLLYRNADWLLKQWAGSYFKLDGHQLSLWEPKLQEVLRRHRHDEVPRLLGLIDGIMEGTRVGFDEARGACLGTELWQAYLRQAGYGVDLLTPLLELLTPGQVDLLAAKFAKEDDDPPVLVPAGVERRQLKRVKRYTSTAEWLVGPLTQEQRTLVERVAQAVPDTAPPWYQHQKQQQQAVIALLREKAGPKRLHHQLVDWWVDFGAASPDLQKAQSILVAGMGQVITGLGQSLTPAQKSHLLRELEGLRLDFVGEKTPMKAIALPCLPELVGGSRHAPSAGRG